MVTLYTTKLRADSLQSVCLVLCIVFTSKGPQKKTIRKFTYRVDFVNITFATPMVGNFPLREEQNHNGQARDMFHFVLAEDIVPAALFTRQLYEKLPWFFSEATLNVILWAVGCKEKKIKECVTKLMGELKSQRRKENMVAEQSYAPMGNYFYVKRVESHKTEYQLFELPHGNDPQYTAQGPNSIEFFGLKNHCF